MEEQKDFSTVTSPSRMGALSDGFDDGFDDAFNAGLEGDFDGVSGPLDNLKKRKREHEENATSEPAPKRHLTLSPSHQQQAQTQVQTHQHQQQHQKQHQQQYQQQHQQQHQQQQLPLLPMQTSQVTHVPHNVAFINQRMLAYRQQRAQADQNRTQKQQLIDFLSTNCAFDDSTIATCFQMLYNDKTKKAIQRSSEVLKMYLESQQEVLTLMKMQLRTKEEEDDFCALEEKTRQFGESVSNGGRVLNEAALAIFASRNQGNK